MIKQKAQITLEATLLLAIFVAAGLAMQVYFRRAIQGNWRANADSFSDEQFDREEWDVLTDPEKESTITFMVSRQDYGRSQYDYNFDNQISFRGPKIKVDLGADQNFDSEFNVAPPAGGEGFEFIDIPNWSQVP